MPTCITVRTSFDEMTVRIKFTFLSSVKRPAIWYPFSSLFLTILAHTIVIVKSRNRIAHSKIPHLEGYVCPGSCRVTRHELMEREIVMRDIFLSIGWSCWIDEKDILPNFGWAMWISMTVNHSIDPECLFPLTYIGDFLPWVHRHNEGFTSPAD